MPSEDYEYGFEDGPSDAKHRRIALPEEAGDYLRGYQAGVAAWGGGQ